MAKYTKVQWQTGMEVTPQVFINADNFQIEQQNIIRRIQVMPCYGLLPESSFNMDISISGNILTITNLVMQAITQQGEIIDMNEQGKEPQKIDLSSYSGETLYIALHYNDAACAEKDTFCVTTDPKKEKSAVVMAKISSNIIDFSYIPPCISINSHQKLVESFEEIRKLTQTIVSQAKEQEKYKPLFLPLSLLELELNAYSAFETPLDLFLMIQKLAHIFKSIIYEVPENTAILLDKTYCHTELYDMIRLLLDSLCELEELSKAPIEAPKIQKIQIAVK